MPVDEVLPRHADAQALRRRRAEVGPVVGHRRRPPTSSPADRGRRWPAAPARRPSTVRVNGPTWSSEEAKAISAVAGHAAVGRLEADDAAERGRLADRAAGVGAEARRGACPPPPPPPSRRDEPPGTRSGPTGCGSGRSAEFSVDEPMANSSMFVLPRSTAPASASRAHHGRVVGRDEALEDLRAARGADAARAEARP